MRWFLFHMGYGVAVGRFGNLGFGGADVGNETVGALASLEVMQGETMQKRG
jgi:hypothetical protein